MSDAPAAPEGARSGPRLRWWREVAYILAFYGVYTLIRNRGVETDSRAEAFANAEKVIDLERRLGSFWEEAIQDWFLPHDWFISFWNVFYGTAHFVVTAFALVYLFRRMAPRYPLWRNVLACTTALALIGYAAYPLMPPRLLPAHHGFVDTLREVGGLWSFESEAVEKVSNQYAAMPSLHFAWSTWCALVLAPAARRRGLRLLVIAYPLLTLFAIVVTANHYWLDAAGGAVVLGVGYLAGRAITRRPAPALLAGEDAAAGEEAAAGEDAAAAKETAAGEDTGAGEEEGAGPSAAIQARS